MKKIYVTTSIAFRKNNYYVLTSLATAVSAEEATGLAFREAAQRYPIAEGFAVGQVHVQEVTATVKDLAKKVD